VELFLLGVAHKGRLQETTRFPTPLVASDQPLCGRLHLALYTSALKICCSLISSHAAQLSKDRMNKVFSLKKSLFTIELKAVISQISY